MRVSSDHGTTPISINLLRIDGCPDIPEIIPLDPGDSLSTVNDNTIHLIFLV